MKESITSSEEHSKVNSTDPPTITSKFTIEDDILTLIDREIEFFVLPEEATSIFEDPNSNFHSPRDMPILNGFTGCINMISCILHSKISCLPFGCFIVCSSLVSFVVPTSVTILPSDCFNGCTSLSSITLHDRINEISDFCFHNCHSLTSFIVPPLVTLVSDGCFSKCTSLCLFIMFEGVSRIGGWDVWNGCVSLARLFVPRSVLHIGAYSFNDCSPSFRVTVPNPIVNFKITYGEGD